ncbi:MAG: hypothetical protein GQ550_03035, partial [Gammaproteobacteria bacterium]|nr:hypothetical protein [Gammaproteobacteria bacterium]
GLGTPGTASLVVIENEIFSADTADEPIDTDVTTGGGGGGGSSSIDLITLILFISFGLYRRNIRIRRYGLHHVSR